MRTGFSRGRQASFRPILECLEERSLLDAATAGFIMTNLLSDLPGVAAHQDMNLVNPWGFAETPQGKFQVSLNGTGLSQAINAEGETIGQPVVLPAPSGGAGPTSPNGAVLNTTDDFVITENGKSAPATFLVSTEDGTIVGFNPQLDPTHGVIFADQSAAGAVYKLLADASNSMGNFLFATNFHNNSVDVFDKNGGKVTLGQNGWGTFTDPNAPAGYAPFGIKLLTLNGQDRLFVSYAKQDVPGAGHDDVAGPGNGFIDEFTTTGQFIQRFATGSAVGGTAALDSPIGMAVAPEGFGPGGKFGGALLVGNFGDSHVSAFDLQTGQFLGQLSDPQGNPLTLNGGVGGSGTKGLWGIGFGTGQGGTDPQTLYFASGVNDETDGVFGKVTMTEGDHDHDHGPPPPPANPGPTTGPQAIAMRLQDVFSDLAQLQGQIITDLVRFGPSALNTPAMLLMSDSVLSQDLTHLISDEIALIATVEQTLIDAVLSQAAMGSSMGR
jgi:uncharacterized protein (TIGR03118 family)